MNEEQIKVQGIWQDGMVLLQCSACGALGVSAGSAIAKAESAHHMAVVHEITWVVQS